MISAIITTHNRPHFLRKSVLSVRQQSEINEVLVIDDSDEANKQLNLLVITNFPEIRYLPIECKGASYSRNYGAQNAMGTYIAFLDDDD